MRPLAATAGIACGRLGVARLFFATVGSTNDVARVARRRRPTARAQWSIADAQTAGRGRRGHALVFAAGSRPVCVGGPRRRRARAPIRDRATALLTLSAGVALAEGDRAAHRASRPPSSGRTICCVGRRKLAGILAEGVVPPSAAPSHRSCSATASTSAAAAFPPELSDRATSLESELGRPSRSRAMLLRRDARRARATATTTCSTGGSMLFSTPGARGRPAAAGAARRRGRRRPVRDRQTAGIDETGALLVRRGDRDRADRRRGSALALTHSTEA